MAPLAPPLRQFSRLTSKIRPARSFPSSCFRAAFLHCFSFFFSSSSSSPSTACYLFIFSPLLLLIFSRRNFSTASFNLLPSVSILSPDSSLPYYRPILQAISGSKRLPVRRQKLFSRRKKKRKKKRIDVLGRKKAGRNPACGNNLWIGTVVCLLIPAAGDVREKE